MFALVLEFCGKYCRTGFSLKYSPERADAFIWQDRHYGLSTYPPGCVLLNQQKEFQAFGYEAETTYETLTSDGEEKDWWMFRDTTTFHNTEVR